MIHSAFYTISHPSKLCDSDETGNERSEANGENFMYCTNEIDDGFWNGA